MNLIVVDRNGSRDVRGRLSDRDVLGGRHLDNTGSGDLLRHYLRQGDLRLISECGVRERVDTSNRDVAVDGRLLPHALLLSASFARAVAADDDEGDQTPHSKGNPHPRAHEVVEVVLVITSWRGDRRKLRVKRGRGTPEPLILQECFHGLRNIRHGGRHTNAYLVFHILDSISTFSAESATGPGDTHSEELHGAGTIHADRGVVVAAVMAVAAMVVVAALGGAV